MGCRGVLYAIDAATEQRLRAVRKKDREVMAIVEELQDLAPPFACETDVAWDAIHLALIDGAGSRKERKLVELAILGGKSMHRGGSYLVRLVAPDEVARLAPALAAIDEHAMGLRFDRIRPRRWMPPWGFGPHGKDHMLGYFPEVVALYTHAAAAGRAVVFIVDQ